jgi:putative transposase
LHRKVFAAGGGRALTLEETHVAVAKWVDDYINRPQRGHLNGKCPAEVFLNGRGPGVNELELRHLMMAKTVRKVDRSGIRLLGHRYYAEELASLICGVQVRYDIERADSILVYTQDGSRLICEARRVDKVHPAADLLGTAQDQQVFRDQLALKRAQETRDTSYVRGVLDDCLADNQRRMEALTPATPTPAEAPAKPLSAAKVARIETAREQARAERAAAPAYTPPEQQSDITTELEKYEYLFDLQYRKGIALRTADAEWTDYYEHTEEYAVVAAPRYEVLRKRYEAKAKAN